MTTSAEFWNTAAREGFVTTELAAEQIERDPGTAPSAQAVTAGVLTAVETEIVEHLLDPHGLVPGYELLSHLGHGGMGIVYRARQTAFDRVVALKTVLVGPRTESTSLARFEQEARSLGRLVHPHLVTAYDFSRHGGRLSLAMEYIAGVDAERWSRDNSPAPERTVWGIIRQAASALACAAAAGVIHRDVKPANLLLTTPPPGFPLEAGLPLVKVADFGLALLEYEGNDRTRLTMENMAVGSPHFMAPEQLAGERVDHRADIYALGATAYHLLTGSPPFHGLSLVQVLTKKLHEDPPPVSAVRGDLSPASFVLVSEMMRRNPTERLSDYATLLQRIDALLAGSTAGTMPGPTGESTLVSITPGATSAGETREVPAHSVKRRARPVSRRKRLASLAAVVGLVVIAGIILALNGGRQKGPGPRVWMATGWSQECFDGLSLRGWRVAGGRWIPGRDDGEGARLLAGSDGSIVFPLVKRLSAAADATPLRSYQVILLAATNEAGAAELQFAISAAGNVDSAERGVVRLTPGRAVLGTRNTPRGDLTHVVATRELPGEPRQFHEIRLERQPTDWYVLVEDTLLGTIPVRAEPIRPEFRLAVEGTPEKPAGEAWFGDILVDETAPVKPAAGK